MNRNRWILVIVLLLVVAGGVSWYVVKRINMPHKSAATVPEGSLLQPSFDTRRHVESAQVIMPHPTPTPEQVVNHVNIPFITKEIPPGRLYTSNFVAPTPKPVLKKEDGGYHAPFGRLVRCRLVMTVDSSSLTTPVIGTVTDDVCWDGHLIIGKCSEVHGLAQVDRVRERIASEGTYTFVLNENGNLTSKQLVVKGEALDREYDPSFQSYGITNGSPGLKGTVIQTDKLADIKIFLATAISGITNGLASTTSFSGFGQNVYNSNGTGAGGIPGYAINPIVTGTQAVLDRYAQMVLNNLERDGFFIRVPSGTEFYVYVMQDIDTATANKKADDIRRREDEQFLKDRDRIEDVTTPRSVRDERELRKEQGQQFQQEIPSLPELNNNRSWQETLPERLPSPNPNHTPANPGYTPPIQ